MFVIVGYVLVLGSIFGGYALAGGHLGDYGNRLRWS